MTDLDKQSQANLETLAASLRSQIQENLLSSSTAIVDLKDIEWELEKRRWRHKP